MLPDKQNLLDQIATLEKLTINMANTDFLLTWEKSDDQLLATVLVAELLKKLYEQNVNLKVFNSGLAVSNFRDNSTRTRFSFASAANLLGLTVQDIDETKSQIQHGETVRETATMISFLTEVIGIRDDKFIGLGNSYMKEVAESVETAFQEGILNQRPTLVNLQCDIDHPTQSMADLLHLKNYFGGLNALRGKKIAMTWAYSPSYGKPLSVPQGIIGLMSRFGMDVRLAYPEGYELMPEVIEVSKNNSKKYGGSFKITNSMEDAFSDADIVYPKSWAPFYIMEKRSESLRAGKMTSAVEKELEKECLENNEKYIEWECTENLMNMTKNGKALYMHCLPADITGVSCKQGEVAESVFDRYRADTYKEAGYKPFAIAAMMFLSKFENPAAIFRSIIERHQSRILV